MFYSSVCIAHTEIICPGYKNSPLAIKIYLEGFPCVTLRSFQLVAVCTFFFARYQTSCPEPSAFKQRFNGWGNKLSTKSLTSCLLVTQLKYYFAKRNPKELKIIDHPFPTSEQFRRFTALAAHNVKGKVRGQLCLYDNTETKLIKENKQAMQYGA